MITMRLAMRLVRVLGELAGHGDDLVARRAGDALGPGRRVGGVVVVALGAAAQATVDAVLRHLQVEHRGHQRFAVLAFLAQAQAHRPAP
jgi:L-fucose mutarotase/ribose pyranase (RbsD/FucU family)